MNSFETRPKLPGGPACIRPIEVDGVVFDPFDPPKQLTSGSLIGGRKLSLAEQDAFYYPRFLRQPYASELSVQLENHVFAAHNNGGVITYSAPTGKLGVQDREIHAAYRRVAQTNHLFVGEFTRSGDHVFIANVGAHKSIQDRT